MLKTQVSGFAEARKVLKKMPIRVQKSILTSASGAGARVLARAVKTSAPVGAAPSQASQKYGTIKMNIRVKKLKYDIPAGISVHRVSTGHAFWGSFQEFGTAKMAARPWFRPAIDASAAAAQAKVKAAIGRRLLAEASKLAGEYRVAKKSLR